MDSESDIELVAVSVNSIYLSAVISSIRKWTLIVNYPRVSGVPHFPSHPFDFSSLFSPSVQNT